MVEYKLITYNNERISRTYEGYVITEDKRLEKFHPSHPQANELEETHDRLIRRNPKIKSLTTIVIEKESNDKR